MLMTASSAVSRMTRCRASLAASTAARASAISRSRSALPRSSTSETLSRLAMTAPHSCARTDRRNVSWSDRSSLPVTIKKT